MFERSGNSRSNAADIPLHRSPKSWVALALSALAICLTWSPALADDANSAPQGAIKSGAKTPQSSPASKITYGEPHTILTDDGPISFGTIISVEVVSWSAPNAKDLLISRLWDGIYLYPSLDLKNIGAPLKLCDTLGLKALSICTTERFANQPPMIIGAERKGSLFHLKKVGTYPNLRLKKVGPVRDSSAQLPFNIPFNNPNYQLDSAGGYIDLEYFNYVFPTFYPLKQNGPLDLVAGDWAGRLWWMPRKGMSDELPLFVGEGYKKSDGHRFAKPKFEAIDENGKPFLLGFAVENGKRHHGGVTRPIYYQGDRTGSDDLIVLGGTGPVELFYLKRIAGNADVFPRFANFGRVQLAGNRSDEYDAFACHAMVATFQRDGWNQLLISSGSNLAVYENEKLEADCPAFRFSHFLSGRDVPLRGWNYTEVLRAESGKKYLLENDNYWCFRELRSIGQNIRVSSDSNVLYDQNGVFRADAETDPNHTIHWGFHRAALWDFNDSGKQHLIVGSDGGHLYLLRQDKPLGIDDRFEFTSFGPLSDSTGKVIKIHNRVSPAAIDLNGDGQLDLVLGGASYQMGVHIDPTPGGGLYYALNRGIDAKGLPILGPVLPLETVGHEHTNKINQHYQIQTLDLTGDGTREVIVATSDDKFRGHVYRPTKDRTALEPTGLLLPGLSIEERLLDLDGDGSWEYVKSGSESLIGTYQRVTIE